MKSSTTALLALLFIGALTSDLSAQLQPSIIFSNGMVLQREVPIPVWGVTASGEDVTITLNDSVRSGFADENGDWRIELPAMDAGGPFLMIIESGTDSLAFTNAYIGDVWLASGQSNMEMPLSQSDGSIDEINSANDQMFRQFLVPKAVRLEPVEEIPAGSVWSPATTGTVSSFSAAGYYFGKELRNATGVPIGLINASYGGSRIEAWMNEEMLGFGSEIELAGGNNQERQPTTTYNGMLHPLIGIPIKGFIWYQGESNADTREDALEYGSLFMKMINGWRALWGMGDLPFIWVQLPNFGEVYETPQDWDVWPQLRANQSRMLTLPNTGEAVTIDVGDVDIHPTNKKPVGERLALIARHMVYGEDLVYSGPRYRSHELLADGKVAVIFDHIADSLTTTNDAGKSVSGFAVADAAGALSWADAQISGDTVIVWNDAVPDPAIIRYAWEYNPAPINLANSAGLPAAPLKINVTDPGFGISYFDADVTTIERGKSLVLSWEVFGSSEVTLNGSPVDSISGCRVIPVADSTFILRAVDRENSAETDSVAIDITVIDPLPTISIRIYTGNAAEPESEVTIYANAEPPADGTITKVEFFMEDNLIATDTESPYSAVWTTPSETGIFTLTGAVTDHRGSIVVSDPITFLVANLNWLVYEAEDAASTGTSTIKTQGSVSNGMYRDYASNGWTLTFDNVEVEESGVYPMEIRYLLNYESPKAQELIVNGTSLGEITFTAPNATTWMSLYLEINLNAGMNTIVIDDSWGWMSFDFIAIALEDDGSALDDKVVLSKPALENYPNPFNSYTIISYTLPEAGMVDLGIYDLTGKKVATLVNQEKPAGTHNIELDASQIMKGPHFARLTVNSETVNRKILSIE